MKNLYKSFALVSILCVIFSIFWIIKDYKAEWKKYQKQYLEQELRKAETKEEKETIKKIKLEIKQILIPELNRVDRCTTCHLTVEDKTYGGFSQPLSYHPNHNQHPFEKFGCTICHLGQGRAITKNDAHGNVPHWESPMLSMEYIHSSCGKCHIASDLPVADDLANGKNLFDKKGCLGCHKLEGRGNTIGPELTSVGRQGHRNSEWLFKHFKDPQSVSPGTPMPKFGFTDKEAKELTLYMLSLTNEKIGGYYISKKILPEATSGKRLFNEKGCINCHSIYGKGGKIGPDLTYVGKKKDTNWITQHFKDPQALSPGTIMPKFGFTDEEAKALTSFLLNIRDKNVVGYLKIPLAIIPVERGKSIFEKYGCSGCHGENGKGKIRNPNAETREEVPGLIYVSEGYTREKLKKKIQDGALIIQKKDKKGPTPPLYMPSWKNKMSEQEIEDLISYLMSLAPKSDLNW